MILWISLTNGERNKMRSSLFISLAILCSCNPLPYVYEKMGWENDNFAEEAVEFVIENRTGINADLTPESPE